MSTIRIDEAKLPDMIEAQLTLSYGRLSTLIREIVNQGNGHEDDIAELRERLDRLERENDTLRTQTSELQSRHDKDIHALKSQFAGSQEELKRLQSALTKCPEAATSAAREECRTTLVRTQDTLQHLEKKLHACTAEAAQQADRLEVCENFVHLWAADAKQMKILTRGEADAPDDEHRVREWAMFLQSLPALAHFTDEMAVLRSLIQTQGSEAIKTKMIAAAASASGGNDGGIVSDDDSRRDSSAWLGSRSRAAQAQKQQLENMQQDITAAMRELQTRLSAVESSQQQQQRRQAQVSQPQPVAITTQNTSATPSSSSIEAMESRLKHLEGRMGAIVSASVQPARAATVVKAKVHEHVRRSDGDSQRQKQTDAAALHSDEGGNTGGQTGTQSAPQRNRNRNSHDNNDDDGDIAAQSTAPDVVESLAGASLGAPDMIALADLTYRVKHLESVVNGLPLPMSPSAASASLDIGAANLLDSSTHPRHRSSSEAVSCSASGRINDTADTHNRTHTGNIPQQQEGEANYDASAGADEGRRNDSRSSSRHRSASAAREAAEAVSDKQAHHAMKDGSGATAPTELPRITRTLGDGAAGGLPLRPSHPPRQPTAAAGGVGGEDRRSPSASASWRTAQKPVRPSSGAAANGSSAELSAVQLLRQRDSSSMLLSPRSGVSGRQVSVHMEPEDGLCRRVALVEENVAVLELNKADRTELHAMEERVRQAISRCESATQAMNHLATGMSGQRASGGTSGNNSNSILNSGHVNGNHSGGYREDGRMDSYHRHGVTELSAPSGRPFTATRGRNGRNGLLVPTSGNQVNHAGRPVYVNSASLNLRDGSRLTSATVSPPTSYN